MPAAFSVSESNWIVFIFFNMLYMKNYSIILEASLLCFFKTSLSIVVVSAYLAL